MALQQLTLIRAKYDGENEVTDFFSLGNLPSLHPFRPARVVVFRCGALGGFLGT
jgi:hypothetical protein